MLIQSGRVFQTIQLLLIICFDIDLTIGNNPHLPSLYLISLTRVMLKEIIFIYLHSRCWYLSHEYLFLFYFILFFYQKVGIHALAQAQKLLSFFPSKYFLKKQNRKPSTDNWSSRGSRAWWFLLMEGWPLMCSSWGREKTKAFCFVFRERERERILFSMSIILAPNGRPSQDGDILFQCPRLI